MSYEMKGRKQLTSVAVASVGADAIWSILRDSTSLPKWAPVVHRVESCEPDGESVGAVRRCEVEMGGRAGKMVEQCVDIDPGRSIAYLVAQESFGMRKMFADYGFRILLEPTGAKETLVTFETFYTPRNVLYKAVDDLGLTPEQSLRIGEQVAERTQSAFLSTLLRGLRGVVTPATVLSRMDRFWSRSSRGGAPRVVQTGPAELRIEVHGAQFLDFSYNRSALMGYYKQAVAPSARQITIREAARPGAHAAAWITSWV